MKLYDVLQVTDALVKCVYYVKNYKNLQSISNHVLSATERIMPADVLMRILFNMACDDARI